jgi:hypothetical protein
LELNSRDKWNGETLVLEKLKTNCLALEGTIERGIESIGDIHFPFSRSCRISRRSFRLRKMLCP